MKTFSKKNNKELNSYAVQEMNDRHGHIYGGTYTIGHNMISCVRSKTANRLEFGTSGRSGKIYIEQQEQEEKSQCLSEKEKNGGKINAVLKEKN